MNQIEPRLKQPWSDRLIELANTALYAILRLLFYILILTIVLGVAHLITITTGVQLFDIHWVLDGKITAIDALVLFVLAWFIFAVFLDWTKFN